MKFDRGFFSRNKGLLIVAILLVVIFVAFILSIVLIPIFNNQAFVRTYTQSETDTTTEEYFGAKENFIYAFDHYFDDFTSIKISKIINLSTVLDANVNDFLEAMKKSKFDSYKINAIAKALNENKVSGVVVGIDLLKDIVDLSSFTQMFSTYFDITYADIFKIVSKIVSKSNLSVNDISNVLLNLALDSPNENVVNSINKVGVDKFKYFISTVIYYIRQLYGDINLKELNNNSTNLIMEIMYQLQDVLTADFNSADMEKAMHLFVNENILKKNEVVKAEVALYEGQIFDIFKVLGNIAKNVTKDDVINYSAILNDNCFENRFNFVKSLISRIEEALVIMKNENNDSRFNSVENYAKSLISIFGAYDKVDTNILEQASSLASFTASVNRFLDSFEFFKSNNEYSEELNEEIINHYDSFINIANSIFDLIIKPLEINFLVFILANL